MNNTYVYSIYACSTMQNNSCVKTGDTNDITIASNIQPDTYENDDLPFELNNTNQTIRVSVTQQRSFHIADDQDWTRITFSSGVREFDIKITSNEQNLFTQLTLFDEGGNIVGCALNTPDVVTGNARLRLPSLPFGEYLLRVEQQDNGSVRAPIANYNLITTISVSDSGDPIEFPDCRYVKKFPRAPNTSKLLIGGLLNFLFE